MKNIYLSFLALRESLQIESGGLAALDPEAKVLLEIIAVQHSQGSPMKVMDAMRLSALASPATIHRKLSQLAQAGLIEMTHQGDNRRKKFLIPTALAEKYFAQAGDVMAQAVAMGQPS